MVSCLSRTVGFFGACNFAWCLWYHGNHSSDRSFQFKSSSDPPGPVSGIHGIFSSKDLSFISWRQSKAAAVVCDILGRLLDFRVQQPERRLLMPCAGDFIICLWLLVGNIVSPCKTPSFKLHMYIHRLICIIHTFITCVLYVSREFLVLVKV